MGSFWDIFSFNELEDKFKEVEELRDKLAKPLVDETAETFLETLLCGMKIKFFISQRYRRNIENFKASYMFMSQDKGVTVNVIFDNGKMEVKEQMDDNANVFIKFKSGKALMNFILKGGDILQGLLNNEVIVLGNWNYMYKFGFMAKHLQLSLTGEQPL